MKIVADENIPLVEHYFGGHGELLLKPGRLISRDDLFDADVLLVRSVTKVDKLLLHETPVKFVGSATTGDDHLDLEYLDSANIHWYVAKGCNAIAVSEYVICIIAALQKIQKLPAEKVKVAVVGVGGIGKLVVNQLKLLGCEVIQCDPLRALEDKNFFSTPLDQLKDMDLITLHTPITYQGKFPTFHLINKSFLQKQKPGCVLLNTSRGAVISFEDLKKFGTHIQWCLDVWEQEPEIDLDVLQKAIVATPHIAGYSIQSKFRGIQMVYAQALKQGFISHQVSNIVYPTKIINTQENNWRDVLLDIYNPLITSQQMKESISSDPNSFDNLRKNFPERNEFEYAQVFNPQLNNPDKILLQKLGVRLV